MTRNLVGAVLTSGLLAAGSVLAAPPSPGGSPPPNSAICVSIASSEAKKFSFDAFLGLGVQLGLHTCQDEPLDVTVHAEAFALAIAKASVLTYVACDSQGEASGHATAYASAIATAKARGKAVVQGWLSVSGCEDCEAAIHTYSAAADEVVVTALASAQDSINVYGNDPINNAAQKGTIISNIVADIVPLYVEVVATLVNDADGCSVGTSTCAFAGDSAACCNAHVQGHVHEIATDGFAAVVALAEANVCSWHQPSDADAFAYAATSAIATAVAKAVVSAQAYCWTDGYDSAACFFGKATITAIAEAQAKAFALAWAATGTECGCEIAQKELAESVATITARATASVFAAACASGGADAFLNAIVVAISEQEGEALAEAIAYAWTNGEYCDVDADALACTGCAYNGQKCQSPAFKGTTKKCCDHTVCTKSFGAFAVCVPEGDHPGHWDGEVIHCPE